MPSIATVIKAEITRLARKELRAQAEGLRRAVSTHRSEIAALKRRIHTLEKELRKSSRASGRALAPEAKSQGPVDGQRLRFSAKGMASNRRRLNLSAEDFGLLVGTSGQTIYGWESGKTQPRPGHVAAIAALRAIGKREAMARLAALRQAA